MNTRTKELDRFYELIDELRIRCGGTRILAECNGRMSWPRRGVYLFFENGELRSDGVTPRVVRVGTHGLRPSKSTLWGRLNQHKGHVGGSFAGGGNHRGSVFRRHVGSALLASGEWPDAVQASWPNGQNASRLVRATEHPLERAVTATIGSMPFLWLAVDDEPSSTSDRGVIEVGSIALLSNIDRAAIDGPSDDWLGRRARSDLISRSGIWNVNHVQQPADGEFLRTFESWLERMN